MWYACTSRKRKRWVFLLSHFYYRDMTGINVSRFTTTAFSLFSIPLILSYCFIPSFHNFCFNLPLKPFLFTFPFCLRVTILHHLLSHSPFLSHSNPTVFPSFHTFSFTLHYIPFLFFFLLCSVYFLSYMAVFRITYFTWYLFKRYFSIHISFIFHQLVLFLTRLSGLLKFKPYVACSFW